jgi:hypothetical protein
VLAEGHPWSPVHEGARTAMVALLSMVPWVEVVRLYDGFDEDSPCTTAAREPPRGSVHAAHSFVRSL